jgi:hypothetical protein
VSVRDEVVGAAQWIEDAARLIRRFGVDLEADDIGATLLIEWRGGGPRAWWYTG